MKTEDKIAYGILAIGLLVGLPLLIYGTNRPKPQETVLSHADVSSQELLGDQGLQSSSSPLTQAVTQSPATPTSTAVASPPIQPANPNAASTPSPSKPLKQTAIHGKNAGGDIVVWSDGTIWADVTVEAYRVSDPESKASHSGSGSDPILKLTDVPIGKQPGIYHKFASVALRTTNGDIPSFVEPRSFTTLFRTGRIDPRPKVALPALRAKYDDLCLAPWQPEAERLLIHPEYSGQVTVDGKPLAAQFKVTVTHLIVKGEKVVTIQVFKKS